jgi:hypothetical protein
MLREIILEWEKQHLALGKEMVKIGEVDEHSDGEGDEECIEIDPAEFAKKVNLKETDDVVLVAATGKVVLSSIILRSVLLYSFPPLFFVSFQK